MYGANKKMLNLLILKVLQEHSDAEHRLMQGEIIRLLQLQYGITCDRRSVRSNIQSLQDMGYDIATHGGCWLVERDFDNAELRMLIDSVLFSRTLSTAQARRLVEKLRSFGNRYFHAKVAHISNLPELSHADNKQVMIALDVLNDAIEEKRKVRFTYNTYGTDFKLHPKRSDPYTVNPYQLAAHNGWYYLIGNHDAHDNVSHYRVDRITAIEMLPDAAKPKSAVREFARGFSLPRHMAEHIYMFGGESVTVKLRTNSSMMDALVDWFGKDFRIMKEENDQMIVTLSCNEMAMKYWALQYGLYVEILEPQSLRMAIKEAVQQMSSVYEEDI